MQVLAHNLMAKTINCQLSIVSNNQNKVFNKISSGYRINKSADDAAGLSISEKMRKQIRGLSKASYNAKDGISLCQVADGALNETNVILQRMSQLTIQSSNGTNSDNDRGAIQSEIEQLINEVDRIADTTIFNEKIHPLKGGLYEDSDDLNISLDVMTGFYVQGNLLSTGNEYNSLSSYIHGTAPNRVIDCKIQLNAKSNELELYALDGTKLFAGDCGIGPHPQDIMYLPKVREYYKANCKYSFDAVSSKASQYFTTW